MSTELLDEQEGNGAAVTRFWRGKPMYQICGNLTDVSGRFNTGFVQLDARQAEKVARAILEDIEASKEEATPALLNAEEWRERIAASAATGKPICPDGGTCHHACATSECFRVRCCGPLSGVYVDNVWPETIREKYGKPPTAPCIEDALCSADDAVDDVPSTEKK